MCILSKFESSNVTNASMMSKLLITFPSSGLKQTCVVKIKRHFALTCLGFFCTTSTFHPSAFFHLLNITYLKVIA